MKRVCDVLPLHVPALFAMVILACTGDVATEMLEPQAQVTTATGTERLLPVAAPELFYTGDWSPGYRQDYGESTVYISLLSYYPSIDEEPPAVIRIGCVQPAEGEPFIDIMLALLGYVFDVDKADVQLSWDGGPAAVESWDTSKANKAVTPRESEDYEHHLAFVDRLGQHDHLTIDFENASGWKQASFLLTGFRRRQPAGPKGLLPGFGLPGHTAHGPWVGPLQL